MILQKGGSEMFTSYLRTLRMFSRDVCLYLITWVLIGFSFFGIYGVLFNLYLLRLGYGIEFVGLVNAALNLANAAFCLPAGALVRRWGSRRMLIVGLSLSAVGYGLLPLAEFIPAALQAGWLLTTYSLVGLGLALYIVSFNPFVMSATSPEERNHVYSVQFALLPLSGFVGSLVSGMLPSLFASALDTSLDHPAPYRYPLFIAAVLLILAVLAMLATREVSSRQREETAAKASTAPFGLIALMAVVGLLRLASETATNTFFNVYLDAGLRVSTVQIGALSGAGRLLAVPAALATPLLAARWGNSRIVFLGSLGMAISLLPLALIPHWGAAGGGFMGVIALAAIRNPAINIYAMEIVAPDWRAAMSGAIMMAQGLIWSAMALGGGYIIAALGYRSLFLTGAGLTVASALLFWAYFLRTPRGEFARRFALDRAK
jgi:MFS family permease